MANEVWRRARNRNRCLCCYTVTARAWEYPVHLHVDDAQLSCARKPPRTLLSCTELLIPRALAARAFHYTGGALSRELIINSQYTTTDVLRYRIRARYDDAIIHSCSINARVRCSADSRRRSDLETPSKKSLPLKRYTSSLLNKALNYLNSIAVVFFSVRRLLLLDNDTKWTIICRL